MPTLVNPGTAYVPTANATKLTTLSKKSQLMLLSKRAKTASKEAAEKKEKEAEEEKKKKQAEIDKREQRAGCAPPPGTHFGVDRQVRKYICFLTAKHLVPLSHGGHLANLPLGAIITICPLHGFGPAILTESLTTPLGRRDPFWLI